MPVTNPYYEFTPAFIPGTKARAEDVNTQYQSLQNAFDLLPGDATALLTDTAIFAPESGAGNAYVVTMPDTRTSNQDGDGIRFFATHTNTGACTLDVDGIGAVALVNWTGTALGAGAIVSGQIYEVRYDATNVQFVIAMTTDNVLQVAYAEEWAINPEDVLVSVAAGGDGATEYSAFHWAQKSLASAASGRINTDINTATPPTTEAVTGNLEYYDADDTDQLAGIGFIASNVFRIRNLMRNGDIRILGTTAAGAEQIIMNANAGGQVSLYNNGVKKFESGTTGFSVFGSIATATPPTTEAVQTRFTLFDLDGTDQLGVFGYTGSNALDIGNKMHGGAVTISTEDGAGASQTHAQTIDITSGGLEVNNTLTGAGFERVLTASDVFTADTPFDLIGDINLTTGVNGPVAAAFTAEIKYLDADETDVAAMIGFQAAEPGDLIIQNIFESSDIVFKIHDFNGGSTPFEAMRMYKGNSAGAGQEGYCMANRLIANYLGTFSISNPDPPLMVTTGAGEDGQTASYLGIWQNAMQRFTAGAAGFQSFNINTLGGDVNIGATSGNGGVAIYRDGILKIGANTAANAVYFPNTSSLVPSGGAVGADNALEISTSSQSPIARIGVRASDDVAYLGHDIHGQPWVIEGQNTVGSDRKMMRWNEAGIVDLYSDGLTDTEARQMRFLQRDDTVRGIIGYTTDGVFRVMNQVHGASVLISGEDTAAGTVKTIMDGNPDGAASLYYNGIAKLATVTGGATVTGTITADAGFINDAGTIEFEDEVQSGNGITLSNPVSVAANQTLRIASGAAAPRTEFYDGMRVYFYDAANTDFMYMEQLRTSAPISMDFNTVGSGVDSFYFGEPIAIAETSAAAADLAARGQIWVLDDAPNRLMFTDDSGQDYYVGMVGGFAGDNVSVNNSYNFNTTDNRAANFISHHDDGGNDTITLEDSTSTTNWPLYTAIQVIAPGSGTITITEGSGTTLYDDTGADTVGGVTVSGGVITIFRSKTTDYIMWGSGWT